jgi:CheY-like chemotaxis protein
VSLPFRAAPEKDVRERDATDRDAQDDAAAGTLAGVRALVVDDVEDARQFVSAVLAQAGAEVLEATSADDALRQIAKDPPDLVVADVGMPGIDGYEFIRRVRALRPAHGGRTPAIALTAYGSAADRAMALAAGFSEHLAKPISPDALLAAVASVIPSAPQRSR